jgi:ABC-type multidrug transport system fused ATPase/permease subunit
MYSILDVKMSYNEVNSTDKKYALNGISFKIKSLLFVECNIRIYIYIQLYRTGSGKTSILNVLLNLYGIE